MHRYLPCGGEPTRTLLSVKGAKTIRAPIVWLVRHRMLVAIDGKIFRRFGLALEKLEHKLHITKNFEKQSVNKI